MGLRLLFITHNLALVRTIADRVVVMTDGRIVEQGDDGAHLHGAAADYTRKLLANTPEHRGRARQRHGARLLTRAGVATRRVLADTSIDLEALAAALGATGVTVAPLDGGLEGDDVVGVVGVVAWEHRIGAAELAGAARPARGADAERRLRPHRPRRGPRHGGVWVCHVPDYCVEEMADTALALALALMRGMVELDRRVRAGHWDAEGAGPLRRIRGTRSASSGSAGSGPRWRPGR